MKSDINWNTEDGKRHIKHTRANQQINKCTQKKAWEKDKDRKWKWKNTTQNEHTIKYTI